MTKAVLKNGVFQPLDPLPTDWAEGMEVDVERATSEGNSRDIDDWKEEMDRAASEIDEGDARLLREAIAQIRAEAKELARQGRL